MINHYSVFRSIFILISFLTFNISNAFAQGKEEAEVAKAVEALRVQLVDPQENELSKLVSKDLSYGHSNGLVEDQATFTASLMSGKFNFQKIDLTEQTIKITGDAAIVRHVFTAETLDAGKSPGSANLKVLQVWHKQGGKWILIARQAVKIAV
ncbi:nuclear transport factor 2 family protein [Dyadobacter flavalbus]|uniref:Nuclear transport factor 2 family protein n=1 Tax=Dyadobacter flavalbus TaxID=2579942 RepID=A0A5M8Q6M8_9BACT|nr:nuclear transport factor 2 family protein [Dyadobacter flavalbus]KAA6431559.1 nuclear transport factor 2 family protein [Dyadobacter flavalbus]